ncbi:N,N-dimethylformamidase beta subunit family domain-containing protein [Dactylosporangium sp. NPDC005555]|uniref:N,N-dimethylformamidase beta subunit family domain-containing protein n=1 Tax=Dactylosporangium sp. NPDC005555 TaxID=3154889 RepID=UPI0033BA9D55
MRAYADATSCPPGGTLRFTLLDATGPVRVDVHDATDDELLLTATAMGPLWTLTVPDGWRSTLCRAVFSGTEGTEEVWFVVRPAAQRRRILVSVPFATWQAYNRSGEPGEGLYFAEEATRATTVTFDRPGGGPPPERWEDGLLRWLRPAGYAVDYCSNLDLHRLGGALLRGYRLFVVNGHDEYWSKEMRDAVEAFTLAGGNVAYFAGNTAFWQARFDDGGRSMTCYRDAVRDPLAATDPARVTVEWSSAPVHRPENTMTGVSYRHGAGAWGDFMDVMKEAEYTVRFAGHWVFAGTGLADGDRFALGAVGYETDAALFEEVDGVPRITGRDGTPASFVILATADLRHWRHFGQGGHATMGVFRLGAGTVFNAATVNWGSALGQAAVDRITRNVLDRLSSTDAGGWEVIGPAPDMIALAAAEHRLFGLTTGGDLVHRELSGQNLAWRRIPGSAAGDPPVCLTAPREAVSGLAVGLYGVTRAGRLVYREPIVDAAGWVEVGAAPARTDAIAAGDGTLFAVDGDGCLWCLTLAALAAGDTTWTAIGPAGGVRAVTGASGLLFGVDGDGRIVTRPPVRAPLGWTPLTGPQPYTLLAGGVGGHLVGAAAGLPLAWREK